ncbi:aprataxin-like protein [Pseudogymnoascus australis]
MASPPEESQDAITEEEIRGTIVPPASSTTSIHPNRNACAYTHNPAAFPPSDVIFYNDFAVAVNDLYPKSSVHTLLLPRSERNLLHPFDAFEDADFLAATVAESEKLRTLVAKELRRRYGKFSELDQARERVLNGEVELPEGRSCRGGGTGRARS